MKLSVRATNPRLRNTLLAMAKADQDMRISAVEKGGTWDYALDLKHTKQLKRILDKYGWPTISMVSGEASNDAWLIAQHADHDIAFQKQCLALLKAASPGEVSLHNIAYLEDRILVSEQKPQLYGTQFQGKAGKIKLHPIEDAVNVDKRRQAMNLGTLAEYKKTMLEMAARANENRQ
ncbi:MAG TPA: DUF6624 domain-containing protein [Patescibacteria group bacterium]|nr:DUF6624 domain-containing protein [Patescibacteria group bacterium]